MRFDNGVDSEKSLVQLKEKWWAKSVCDNNNHTGREWKTFKHYEDIDEFMVSSDKVNPDTDNILLTGNQDCGKKPEKRPATTSEGNSEVAEKTGKTGQQRGKDQKKKKRLSGDDMELAILNRMKSQQESIQRSKENDKRVFEALLKSQAEAQQQHQKFGVSMLGKLGDIFAPKK